MTPFPFLAARCEYPHASIVHAVPLGMPLGQALCGAYTYEESTNPYPSTCPQCLDVIFGVRDE